MNTSPVVLVFALMLAAAVSADAAPLDQTVGQTLRINLNALVKPNPDTGQRPRELNFSRPRPRTAEDVPQVPDGFSIALYAEDLEHARNMEVAPNGDVAGIAVRVDIMLTVSH